MPWTPNLHLHPNMVKKMRTFLEVENKMGPIIPALANQYRLPLPETNPNVRKGNATEKRRTVTPKRKFRLVVPKATVTHSPLPKTPLKPTSNAAAASMPTMVRQDTPWPGTGNMSGNLFQDRNWLLPKDYLATEKREEMEEQDPKEERCGLGPGYPLCQAQKKEANPPSQQEPMEDQQQQKPLPNLLSPTQKKETKWRNKIPKRKGVVWGLDTLCVKHRRRRHKCSRH